jgi:hypothetical protein
MGTPRSVYRYRPRKGKTTENPIAETIPARNRIHKRRS